MMHQVLLCILILALPVTGIGQQTSEHAELLLLKLAQAVYDGREQDAVALLEGGVDPNVVSRDYRLGTPMAWAVIASSRSGNASMVKLLCDHGADPNLRDLERLTPLHRAMVHRGLEAAEVLLKCGADPNAKNELNSTPLRSALASLRAAKDGRDKRAEDEYRSVIRLMLRHGADPDVRPNSGGPTPLAIAVALGDAELVEQLLSAGAPPDVWYGRCPDDVASCFQSTALKRLNPSSENAPSIMTQLLSAGADPNIYPVEYNPLSKAARYGSVEIVEILIAYGVDLERYGPHAISEAQITLASPAVRERIDQAIEKISTHMEKPKRHPPKNDGGESPHPYPAP